MTRARRRMAPGSGVPRPAGRAGAFRGPGRGVARERHSPAVARLLPGAMP